VTKWQEISNLQRFHVPRKTPGKRYIGRLRNGRIILIWLLAICVRINTIEPSDTAVILLTTARAHKTE
jgi:hypothetical protein